MNLDTLPVDGIFLNEEQREEVQRMAALGYYPGDIAIYLGLDPEVFTVDANTPGTTIQLLIREGILVTRATPEMKLHTLAEDGNLAAIQELGKIREQRSFENIARQLDENELY